VLTLQTNILKIQTTATGSIAEILSVRRFLFFFLTKWSKGKNDDGFLEKLKRDLSKWEKKIGKAAKGSEITAAKEIPAAATNGTTKKAAAGSPAQPAPKSKNAASIMSTANKLTAAANTETEKKSTAAASSRTAEFTTATGSTAMATPNGATAKRVTAKPTAETASTVTAVLTAAAASMATAKKMSTAHTLTAAANSRTAKFRTATESTAMANPNGATAKTVTAKPTAAAASMATAKNITATAKNATDLTAAADSTIKVKHPRFQPPINPPVAGPSRQTQAPLYSYRKLRDLDDDSVEDEVIQNPTSGSDNGKHTSPPAKRIKTHHIPNRQYRRPPMPTGVFFSIPCSRCVRRGKPCEKDAQSASCVLCYRLKNRCDYGKRHRETPKPNFKGKGKGKGKQRAKDEDEDHESEESMTEHESKRRKRTAKKIKSSKHVQETDDDMGSEPIPSGYDMSRLPPPSRSPSPFLRPTREAARKAKTAVAAMVAVDMASNMEALQAPEEVDGELSITCYGRF